MNLHVSEAVCKYKIPTFSFFTWIFSYAVQESDFNVLRS